MKDGFYYQDNVFYTDISTLELDVSDRTFSSDSFRRIVAPEDIFHSEPFRAVLAKAIAELDRRRCRVT
jgi:hypothetical protein